MAAKKVYLQISAGVAAFLLYAFAAAIPVPEEDVLVKGWLRSFEGAYTETSYTPPLYPFETGGAVTGRFGYFDSGGTFTVNRLKNKHLSMSEQGFIEYDAIPRDIEINDNRGEPVLALKNIRGYPFFLNQKIYVVSFEQNAVSCFSEEGDELWSYSFTAPLTCIAGAAGYLLAGSLNGAIELLDADGGRVFFFETGGSRIPCVYGAAVSGDASLFAVISGVDNQRFLLFEQYAGSYRVSYHEFTGMGKRRPVRIDFVDNGARVVYERDEGLGIYEIKTRTSRSIPLDGEITSIDNDGSGNTLFLIVTQEEQVLTGAQHHLIAINYPDVLVMKAPFKSEGAFLRRDGGMLFAGTDSSLVSFMMDKR